MQNHVIYGLLYVIFLHIIWIFFSLMSMTEMTTNVLDFLLKRLDKWRSSHCLCLHNVVIQCQLDVIH